MHETVKDYYGKQLQNSEPNYAQRFILDAHHDMQTGGVFPVCVNTWRMLHDTRCREHFTFIGDFGHHDEIFPGCGTDLPFQRQNDTATPGCC